MKKYLKITLWVLLISFVLIQFFSTERNQSTEAFSSDFSEVYDVPPNIHELLQNSCYDCHSNNTHYPWYNKIQPIAWFLENHIREAKSELNFNEFGNYSSRKKDQKLKSIINEIEENNMPLTSYTWMHPKAILTKNEQDSILNWLSSIR